MHKVLVLKEVRENAWMAAVALAAYALVLVTLTGFDLWTMRWYPVQRIPFQDWRYFMWSILIATVYATLLGLRQSWWESVRGTSVFLLHRPIPRRAVFGTKLAAGGRFVSAGDGIALARLRDLGRLARHARQPVRLVDDGDLLALLAGDDRGLRGGLSHGAARGPLVRQPALPARSRRCR